ncbi:MAG TPA: hypothetical protein VES40_14415 [Ilumatobacteraceae bacterium]|nr:hypothetical protein [Ilumatobacteraceae bacterium]
MPPTPDQHSDLAADDSTMTKAARAMPWVARVGWIIVAVIGGSAVQAAVDGRSAAVVWTTAIGAWLLWGLTALALAIASVTSLTVVRVAVPIAMISTIAAAIGGAPAVDLLSLGTPAIITLGAVMAAEFGRQFVQASAYGDEERFPLRMPVAAGSAAVVSWLIWAPALVAGPLLLAAGQWIVGAVLTAIAVGGGVFLGPRWHRLSQRWFVLVPAGIVLRDPVVLADTFPLRANQVAHIGLAAANTEAADLTGPASGYAIEVTTIESVTAVFAFTPAEPNGRAIHLTSYLSAPSRPGAVLRAAKRRGLPVT